MEVRKLAGKRIGEYTLTSEERIKRGDTIIARINLDRKCKRFLLFNYFPLEDQFKIISEGGTVYAIPSDNYLLTIEAAGEKLRGHHSYTVTKFANRNLHFSDGTKRGSFDVRIQN